MLTTIQINIQSIPKATLQIITSVLSHFTILLVAQNKLFPEYSYNGTGVLIKYKNKWGILTAGHVLARLLQVSTKYILLPCSFSGKLLRYTIKDIKYFAEYNIFAEINKELGPDLAFVEIDQEEFKLLNKPAFDLAMSQRVFMHDERILGRE